MQWNSQLQELLLVKCQPASDAVQGITSKFLRPYLIQKRISPVIYECLSEEVKKIEVLIPMFRSINIISD
jgi:hypothetical protein